MFQGPGYRLMDDGTFRAAPTPAQPPPEDDDYLSETDRAAMVSCITKWLSVGTAWDVKLNARLTEMREAGMRFQEMWKRNDAAQKEVDKWIVDISLLRSGLEEKLPAILRTEVTVPWFTTLGREYNDLKAKMDILDVDDYEDAAEEDGVVIMDDSVPPTQETMDCHHDGSPRTPPGLRDRLHCLQASQSSDEECMVVEEKVEEEAPKTPPTTRRKRSVSPPASIPTVRRRLRSKTSPNSWVSEDLD